MSADIIAKFGDLGSLWSSRCYRDGGERGGSLRNPLLTASKANSSHPSSREVAWHEALETEGINLSMWRIHRKVGMSGGLFTNMLFRETGQEISPERVFAVAAWVADTYREYFDSRIGIYASRKRRCG